MLIVKYLIPILFSLSVIFAASYAKDDKIPARNSAFAVPIDTLPTAPNILPGLAPGTVKIKARLLQKAYHPQKTGFGVMILKIDKALGYGAGTPLIAPGDTLKAYYTQSNGTLSTEKQLLCILSYKKNLRKGHKKSIISWQVIAVTHNDQKKEEFE